jgi:hypothetical protein
MFLPEAHCGFMQRVTVPICLHFACKNKQSSLCLPNDRNALQQTLTLWYHINVALIIMLRPNEDAGTSDLLLYDWIAVHINTQSTQNNTMKHSLGVSSPLCILELSRPKRTEKAVKNTTIFVTYKVLVYIQMPQPTICFGFFLLGHLQVGYLSQRKCTIV